MSKGIRILIMVMAAYLSITFLHGWLNIGFDNLGLTHTAKAETFRVGFLPVT